MPGRKVSAPVIETSIITMIMASMASGRHGREPLPLWGATDRLQLGQARRDERYHRGLWQPGGGDDEVLEPSTRFRPLDDDGSAAGPPVSVRDQPRVVMA